MTESNCDSLELILALRPRNKAWVSIEVIEVSQSVSSLYEKDLKKHKNPNKCRLFNSITDMIYLD